MQGGRLTLRVSNSHRVMSPEIPLGSLHCSCLLAVSDRRHGAPYKHLHWTADFHSCCKAQISTQAWQAYTSACVAVMQ